MLNIKDKFTLSQLQNFIAKIFKENALTSAVILLLLGFLSFNLWFLAKHETATPQASLVTSSNLAEPTKTFGQVLSTATQSAPTSFQLTSQIVGKITIAVLGDSMIDTMGDLKNLNLVLSQYYPKVEFVLLNYGVGATKPEDGLARLTQSTTTETKQLQPLLLVKPDIVVLESFSYNHGKNTPEDITTHYLKIKEIVKTLEEANIKVFFLVTIAPTQNYAKGAPGILWDENQRLLEAQTVIEYLKAGLKFAEKENLALINAFTPSLENSGFGKPIYVNISDNIHPSPEGSELVSDLIVQKLKAEDTIEKTLKP